VAISTRSPAIRLRRSDTSEPGIRRRRRGKGFQYLNPDGTTVDDAEVLGRINELVIPPAWEDVWISPYPGGHIQATGVDARGRKQYLYHPKWRARRDQEKFDDMLRFAGALPGLRERVAADLAAGDLSRERVLACAVRLLDKGFFRIGSEDYAVENETYGLATMRKEHVTVTREGILLFDYPAKHGKRRVQSVIDEDVAEIVRTLKRRRGGLPELLAFRDGGRWVDVRSPDINHYLKDTTGLDVSAKDFRTWNATVLAAVALSVSGIQHGTKTGRKRAVVRAIKEVAHYLGNTPAVARASYIDPRVFDRFNDGLTLDPTIAVTREDEPAIQGAVEEAVLDLIADDDSSERLSDAGQLDELVA
jgi:DNA topoisomerase IB